MYDKRYIMNKRIKILFFALVSVGTLTAQSLEERKKITNSYDLEQVKLLQEEISKNERLAQQRINEYLLKNSSAQVEFYGENNVKYRMIDVIDGSPVYNSTYNAAAGRAIQVNHLYPGGSLGLSLEGEGMYVGVWDQGWALKDHVEFMDGTTSRISQPDAWEANPEADSHGTHVVGTVAAKGVQSSARGMAPKVFVKSYNWANDTNEVSDEALNEGLLISNHSYGTPIYNDAGTLNVPGAWYMGSYSTVARGWDQLAYTYPYYLMVASAGNSGGEYYAGGLADGYDKLTGNKNSKNNLVVANADPTTHVITGALISLDINPGSSQGPTDDGRIKPDISADGTSLHSTYNTDTTAYQTLSGTSMSAPSVAGGLILLQEHYYNLTASYMKAATLKGLVCHTAQDDQHKIGPDPIFGWGLLNTREAATVLTNSVADVPSAIVEELVLNQGETYSFEVNINSPSKLMASISWTDLPGTAINGQLNEPTPVLVNDLDIRIIKGSEVYYPWKLQLSDITAPAIKGDNIVDNVERVDLDDAVGTYTIEVTHKGDLTGESQAYSLIVTGFSPTLSQDKFSVDALHVYPNPVNDVLNFDITGNLTLDKVEIYDTIGKKILTSDIYDNSVNISHLTAGVYFVRVYADDSQVTKKIIKN